MVESQPSKLLVAGSIPVSRSTGFACPAPAAAGRRERSRRGPGNQRLAVVRDVSRQGG
ncbi:MAG: hypothetical protein HW398_628 [Acidobacteria bacterium]|nr:hypothetical protein [Acidobacteriota bacterium]